MTKPVYAITLTSPLQFELNFYGHQEDSDITRRTLLVGDENYQLTEADLNKVKMFLAVNGVTEFSDVTDNGNYIMLLLDNRIEFFKKVTITFHSNETNQTVTQDIGYGAKTTLKYDPLVRPGYVLKGWSSNPDSQEITYSNGQTLENETALIANTDLYAIWEPEKYKVSYELNGGLLGLSQILCKHRNAVQIEQNIFKAEVAQAAAALFSK